MKDRAFPAPGKPEQDLDGICHVISAEQGLGGELAQSAANERSPDGHWVYRYLTAY